MNLDIDGFFTSIEFVSQLAAFISTILTALVGEWIGNLLAPAP